MHNGSTETETQNSETSDDATRSDGGVGAKRAHTRGDRRQLILRKVAESTIWKDDVERERANFLVQSVVRRADDDFLQRHPAEAAAPHLQYALRKVDSRKNDKILVGCAIPAVATHGYDLPIVALETSMSDQPFIVDTIKLVLRRLRVRALGTMNMILPVERDEDGTLLDISLENSNAANESFTCHLLSRSSAEARVEEIRAAVLFSLERAKVASNDFRSMRKLVRDVASTLNYCAESMPDRAPEFLELAAFGDWLVNDNFVFLGAYGFDEQNRPTGRLGLGRFETTERPGVETRPQFAFGPTAPLVSIHQSRIDSPVHRDSRMQEIRIRLFDGEGASAGGVVFQGLFTYAALTAPSSNVPVLRHRLGQMVAAEDLVPKSHRMKLFLSFFDRLPLTYTFASNDAEIRSLIAEAVDVDFGGVARVHALLGPAGTVAHVFVIVAADRFGDKLRWQVQEALRSAYGADHVAFRLLSGKTEASMWHYLLQAESQLQLVDTDALSERVMAIVSPWVDRLRELLRDSVTDDRLIEGLALRFADCLPDDYRQRVMAEHLAEDLNALAQVMDGGPSKLALRRDAEDLRDGTIRLLHYTPTDSALTDILPIIDHFGVRVLGEVTTPVKDADGKVCYFEQYRIDLAADQGAALPEHGAVMLEALAAVLDGRMNSTSLNRLLLAARLSWRQLQVLRGYIGYARQLGVTFPPNVVQQVLHDQAPIARTLVDLFDARFDPRLDGRSVDVLGAHAIERQAQIAEVEASFRTQLESVNDAVEDKVLRMFFNLIQSTLRTNYFQREDEARALSCKFRCADVELMRDPRPMYEIFVYDPRVEGIHLRGGPVARGGLRWSDRLDDYRTEILGLMLTQMVKNTLIVPVGSKGGFVVKVSERDEGARRRLADELYKVFIGGLLDVTDNIVDAKTVFPEDVVVWDDADPYLVVAADKGTAHLSDTANGIALSRGFWLGDAFASGGSQGYDHKRYGITARGGWVCVQRHFREMGIDTQRDPISAVGIGDMSGDVFGNGMLLTETLLLKAAFNHRHIFLDPDPQPAQSFAERKRLFALPRSTWADYDKSLISKGGGLFERGAKKIPLSLEVREMLGVEREDVSGEELVRLLLCLDVHLLWNGGIGTYVKASHQTHADAGDKANDGVRVDARQLRCKVIGEGGNLGLTQAARVEFALAGGRINTDAVDNSGGVDLSDHEVNLKILFAPLLQAKAIDEAKRDAVLFSVDHAVCDLVLGDNAQQALGLSLSQVRSAGAIRSFEPVIASLCEWIGIDRELQDLPSAGVLRERSNANQALTRPELARIAAFAKMWLYQELVSDPSSSRHVGEDYLRAYFPERVWQDWHDAISGHMLRHQIICTVWSNEVVDLGGPRLMASLALEYGRPVNELCNAWALASRALDARRLRAAVAALDGKVDASLQTEASLVIEAAVASATRTILSTMHGDAFEAVLGRNAEIIAFTRDAAGKVVDSMPAVRRTELRARARSWSTLGLPGDLALDLTRLSSLAPFIQVFRLAERVGLEVGDALTVWHVAAQRSGLGDLLEADDNVARDRWVAAARASLHQDLSESLLDLAIDVCAVASARPMRSGAIERAVDRDPMLADIWEFARQIGGERDRLPSLVVLTTRLRTRLQQAGGARA